MQQIYLFIYINNVLEFYSFMKIRVLQCPVVYSSILAVDLEFVPKSSWYWNEYRFDKKRISVALSLSSYIDSIF
jgi:hypothetical protein